MKNLFHLCMLILSLNALGQSQDLAKITVDLSKTQEKMKPIYAWFGYDEPNYTYMKDGKKLLSEIAALPAMSTAMLMPYGEAFLQVLDGK